VCIIEDMPYLENQVVIDENEADGVRIKYTILMPTSAATNPPLTCSGDRWATRIGISRGSRQTCLAWLRARFVPVGM
jgi:hypothetical protein